MTGNKAWRLYADYGDTVRSIAEWAERPSEEQIGQTIYHWAEKRNWEIPYFRIWTDEEGSIWYDVGSWSTLLFLKEEKE